MDQCVATILADGEICHRNHPLDLPGKLYAGISPRNVAHIEDQYRARSESGNWPQRWSAETRPSTDIRPAGNKRPHRPVRLSGRRMPVKAKRPLPLPCAAISATRWPRTAH
jgi:hypothetical protein